MKRKAFFLGFMATGAQVLLLRELVATFNGDELFIGTAFFGWLIAVALGAVWGGLSTITSRSSLLFIIAPFLLWSTIVLIRLTPLLFDKLPGEIFPFTLAATLSVIYMAPAGVISGWLFSAINRESQVETTTSIVLVYLYEGIGAFVGGLLIAFLVGVFFSTLTLAFATGLVVLADTVYFTLKPARKAHTVLYMTLTILVILVARNLSRPLDIYLDSLKYKAYTVNDSFDTPYSHQTIITRDSTITLLTDNNIEAVFPDLMITENQLLPALAYKPNARRILILGRVEFGLEQLAKNFPDLEITSLDPRSSLTSAIDRLALSEKKAVRINRDPIAYFTDLKDSVRFDIIILNTVSPDNHKNNIFFTAEFYERLKSRLEDSGLLFMPTAYDTDRYISKEKSELLGIIFETLKIRFNQVAAWPGEMTLFFASDNLDFNLEYETLIGRLSNLPYAPSFINDDYLVDRLSEFKTGRLISSLQSNFPVNRLEKPLLPLYQVIYQSKMSGWDNRLMDFTLKKTSWLFILPVAVTLFLLVLFLSNKTNRRSRLGLFLYFTVGIVSLSFELTIFYVYQSLAGSLYSELSLLVGVFMLGLAVGTYLSHTYPVRNLEIPVLLLMMFLIAAFMMSFMYMPSSLLLIYHIIFMFLMAAATGAVFVSATRLYYTRHNDRNRGLGYALELVGSSLGALMTTTVLLPVIGLQGLLGALIVLLILAFSGSILTKVS
ncbi:MAG: hypothetical protein PHU88_06900 [candidate division Zixibacteria bacterium]|nr:hypothetical protein [candidate division Zixibacteria bacterium]MDD5424940.1 hypothetical protein [candidate division Zixibacteria bacterium]